MQLKLYKVTDTRTDDISDYVLALSQLSWRHERDFRFVLPHPEITVPSLLEIDFDDEIDFEIDGHIRLKTYVSDIRENTKKRTKTLYLNDLLKKLENYYIADLSDNDWSGYTPSLIEYKYVDGSYNEQYIQVAFLLKVMIHKALGIDISNVEFVGLDYVLSPYTHSTGTVPFQYLDFQWRQLRATKKSNSSDESYKSASFLEMLLFILQSAKIKVYYKDDKIYFAKYSDYTTPADDDIYSYKKRDFPEYDFTTATLRRLDPRNYNSTWTEDDLIEEKHQYPIITDGKSLFYSILNNFEYFHLDSSIYRLKTLEDNGHKTFCEQFTELVWNWISAYSKRVEVSTVLEYNINPLANTLNWKDRKSDISYGV